MGKAIHEVPKENLIELLIEINFVLLSLCKKVF